MKKYIFLAVLGFLVFSLNAQNVSDFEIHANDDDSITILNYKGMAREVVIPERIFNMPVTRLRDGAFSGKNLTSVVIPASVTLIGDNVFSGNQLTSITIPAAVEFIGNGAFSGNSLTSVTIPVNVLIIGDNAFSSNQITSIIIPNNVKYIGNSAFSENQLTSITLGTNLIYIGNYAFNRHRATSIIIPNNVVYIGGSAFQPSSSNTLVNITIGRYVMLGTTSDWGEYNNAFSNNNNFDIIYRNNDKRAGRYIFANNAWSFTAN